MVLSLNKIILFSICLHADVGEMREGECRLFMNPEDIERNISDIRIDVYIKLTGKMLESRNWV